MVQRETGRIAPKDGIIALERLPAEHRPILHKVDRLILDCVKILLMQTGKRLSHLCGIRIRQLPGCWTRHFNHDSKM